MRRILIALMIAGCTVGSALAETVLFEMNFDDEPADAGPPTGFSMFGNELADRGVTKQTSTSGKQSAYVVCDFTMETWGVIMISDPVHYDMRKVKLSAEISSSDAFMDKQPVVGFKVIDADGTGYRTAPENLKSVQSSWATIEEAVEDLVPDEDTGEEPGLDIQNIIQYGVIFFDRQDNNKIVTFYIDDVKAVRW